MDENNQEFRREEERYSHREKMTEGRKISTPTVLRAIFGVLMIIVYVGMGILLLINFFGWSGDWAWTRYVVGIALIAYGIWRAYRQYKGIDSMV